MNTGTEREGVNALKLSNYLYDLIGSVTRYRALVDDVNHFLIHPDCDDVILEPGAIVVLEQAAKFPFERWGGDPIHIGNVWKIITK